MKYLYSLILVLFSTITFASNSLQKQNPTESRISIVEESVRELQLDVEKNSIYLNGIDNRVDNLVELQELAIADLSNELNVSNRVVSIFAIILAILAVFLGIYVTWMERKVKNISNQVAEKEKETRDLVDMINGNIDGLYERIRRADTVSLLKRLILVPRDIVNIEARLLSVSLEECDYSLLRSAYSKLVEEGQVDSYVGDSSVTYGMKYYLQFFQHFLGKVIADSELRDTIIAFFPAGIQCSFTNDIDKSTRDLGMALADKGLAIDRASILFEYRKALEYSKYRNRESVIDTLRHAIQNDEVWDDVEDRLTEYRTSPGIHPSFPGE